MTTSKMDIDKITTMDIDFISRRSAWGHYMQRGKVLLATPCEDTKSRRRPHHRCPQSGNHASNLKDQELEC